MSFEPENNPNDSFGIPSVEIKPTLSSKYDPYSGIDLTIQDSCSHIQVMTLPSATVTQVDNIVCEDPCDNLYPYFSEKTYKPIFQNKA